MNSKGRGAQLGSSTFRSLHTFSTRAVLLGAGWPTAGAKIRTGRDPLALALLNVFEGYDLPRRNEDQVVRKPLQIGAAKQVGEKLGFVSGHDVSRVVKA